MIRPENQRLNHHRIVKSLPNAYLSLAQKNN
jgi:hypothetical protein